MNEGLHHLHTRKRIYKNLEKFPSPSRGRRAFDYLMLGIAFFGPLALTPQIVQIYQTKDVSSLVLSTWVLLASFNFLWFTYGILHKDSPIAVASLTAGILNSAGVFGIFMYSV